MNTDLPATTFMSVVSLKYLFMYNQLTCIIVIMDDSILIKQKWSNNWSLSNCFLSCRRFVMAFRGD